MVNDEQTLQLPVVNQIHCENCGKSGPGEYVAVFDEQNLKQVLCKDCAIKLGKMPSEYNHE